MNSLLTSIVSFAQEAAPAAASGAQSAPQGGGLFNSMLIFLPLLGIMYFLMIRPQQKRQKEMQEMLRKLKTGDKVMTTAGAFGTITRVSEKNVVIALDPKNIEVEFTRSAVAEIIPAAPAAAAAPANEKK